jgi:hypothetical protein
MSRNLIVGCNECGAEYEIAWDTEMNPAEPVFCPFCADEAEKEDLEREPEDEEY